MKHQNYPNLKTALFGGGCFWCMVQPFEDIDGVVQVVAGYAGGTGDLPTYADYAQKGYTEAVEVSYDPEAVDYEKLLSVFWKSIDPTDSSGQFADRGKHYQSVIYYNDEIERALAEKSKHELEESKVFDKPVVTKIVPVSSFYPAEQYHQEYYKKNPFRYMLYKSGSGREAFLHKYWDSNDTPKGE